MFDRSRVTMLALAILGTAGLSSQVWGQGTAFRPLPATPAASVAVETALPDGMVVAQARAAEGLADGGGETATAVDSGQAVAAPAASLPELIGRHTAAETQDGEHECLAQAVYFEAKGEPLEGQLAVANVILNRTLSGRFAPTACGVVTQRGQFSFVRGGRLPAVPRASTAWRTAVAVARVAREHLWAGEVAQALYFHARRVAPGWRMVRVAAVGNHIFYR